MLAMPKVQMLPETLASQVAAGEVVERPASVIKELLENSIDAGATQIDVEIRRGGIALMKVSDNGCGMAKDDALMSLERHATSKLRKVEDLAKVRTLGFRGEAVPSIASVSRFTMWTCEHDAHEGHEIVVDGGKLRDVKTAGIPAGTSTEVKDLFFNIPARRKFLRAESTEAAHVEHQVRLHALAHPSIRFTLRKDGRQVFDLTPSKDRRLRISGLAGDDVGRHLVEVASSEKSGLKVEGYVLPAAYARKGKRQQFVFLNGRPVEDASISRGLREAFGASVGDGVHPVAWLWLTMNPALVDVNVHPAKREVRFHKPHEVRESVFESVLRALKPKEEILPMEKPELDLKKGAGSLSEVLKDQDTGKSIDPPATSITIEGAFNNDAIAPDVSSAKIETQNAEELAENVSELGSGKGASRDVFSQSIQQDLPGENIAKARKIPELKVIGPLRDRYVVLEGADGLVLMDPRAARDRVVYEQLLSGAEKGRVDSQGLLVPILLELDARDADVVLRNSDNFAEAGMTISAFGGSTVQVSSLPAFLQEDGARHLLMSLVDELSEGGKKARALAWEVFASRLSKLAGVREKYESVQSERLLKALLACDLPYATSDGRPTLIQLSLQELERKFAK